MEKRISYSNYNTNTSLVNFRVGKTLKDSFDKTCRYENSNRTSVLKNLMKGYIDSKIPEIKKQVEHQQTVLSIFK